MSLKAPDVSRKRCSRQADKWTSVSPWLEGVNVMRTWGFSLGKGQTPELRAMRLHLVKIYAICTGARHNA